MGGARAEDVVFVGRARVDALAIGLKRDASFGSNAYVNSLVVETATELCKAAVATILDVVRSKSYSWA